MPPSAARGTSLASYPRTDTHLLLTPAQLREIPTPAFVYSEARLAELGAVAQRARSAGSKVLFAVKANPFVGVLAGLQPFVDGFSASSLFEANLVRHLWPDALIHLSTPGLRPDEIGPLGEACDFISVNSVTQLRRFGDQLSRRASVGLRVNTGLSFVSDSRYDSGRPGSKLGVSLSVLQNLPELGLTSAIKGLALHTNTDSEDLEQLRANAKALIENTPQELDIEWVNLGGGYLLEEIESLDPLTEIVALIGERFGCEVFIEPGAALVRSAGFLVSEVIDLFSSEGNEIAILDTSVNHSPEVLEFGYQPPIATHVDNAPHVYTVAGSTCLAGDVFGTYRFQAPLTIGEKLVFEDAGAYTLAKAHRFNGVNLPTICAITNNGDVEVRKQYTFEEYLRQWTPND